MTTATVTITPPIAPWWVFPLRLEADDAFQIVREALERTGFTEAGICARVGVEDIYAFKSIREGRPAKSIDDPLDAFIRLFLDLEVVPESFARALFGDPVFGALTTLGLLIHDDEAPDAVHSPV